MSFEQTSEGSDKANYLNIKKENKVIVSQPETAACKKQTVSQIQGHEQASERRAHMQPRISSRHLGGPEKEVAFASWFQIV